MQAREFIIKLTSWSKNLNIIALLVGKLKNFINFTQFVAELTIGQHNGLMTHAINQYQIHEPDPWPIILCAL